MAFTIGVIIGKISVLIYLVVGFFWIWKRIIKLIFKFFDWVIKTNRDVRMESDKLFSEIMNDSKKNENEN